MKSRSLSHTLLCGETFMRRYVELALGKDNLSDEEVFNYIANCPWISSAWVEEDGSNWFKVCTPQPTLNESEKDDLYKLFVVNGTKYLTYGGGIKGKSYDHMWFDELATTDLIHYSYDTPEEPKETTKHNVPFWANDWRNKANKRKKR